MKDFKKEILGYSLRNAMDFGKADISKVLPKLFQHGLQKENIGKIMPLIKRIVKKVNSMNHKERTEAYLSVSKVVRQKEKIKKKELPELPNVKKNMLFRIAPFPSGDLHIGNARIFLINALYAEKYNGKLILVMDDTIGSEEKQVDKNSYKLIQDSLKWLGVKYNKIIYKSDRLKIYYRYAEQLIKKNKAYVCHCSHEVLKENRAKGVECGCRIRDKKENLKRWKEMFKPETKQGSAVLRIKTSMQHPDPSFRDRVLFRISNRNHPRVGNKYKVWPNLEMSWAVDDHLLGISHIIRGNDLMIETKMEEYIWDIFKWKHPEVIHIGLIGLEGIKISKSKSQKEVKAGGYAGWDDPRTWSIHSLKRRGIKKEAIRRFVKDMSLSSIDVIVPIDSLYSINRGMIDSESERHSFIFMPVELKIKNSPKMKTICVPIHPEREEMRKVKVEKIFISKEDLKKYTGKEIRLLHLYNIKLGRNKTANFTSAENKDIPKINWVSEFVKANILMPFGKWINGIAGSSVKNLNEGQIIQFERFGFVRFDKVQKGIYEFWFAHK